MLSELYHIAKNLNHQGQEKRLVHADFGEPGLSTNVNLRLLFNDAGRIVRLEVLQKVDEACLWTLKKGKKRFFPAVRLKCPLLKLAPNDPAWKEIKKPTSAALRSLLAARGKDIQKMDLRGECAQAKRMKNWKHDDHETAARITAFAGNFLELVANDFETTLSEALDGALAHSDDEKALKTLQALLCGTLKEPKNKPPKVDFKVQVIFDYLPEVWPLTR